MELRHSGAIARKDLSELSDEELMDMIRTAAIVFHRVSFALAVVRSR